MDFCDMCRIFTTLEICIDISEKNLYDKDTRRKKFYFYQTIQGEIPTGKCHPKFPNTR